MSVRIRVRLYATLERHRPGTEAGMPFEVQLTDDAAVADLVSHLALPPSEVRVAFVNGRARPLDWALRDGDEVGLFPPVGGG